MKCGDLFLGDRCDRPRDHDGLHVSGEHSWGFRNDPFIPEWVRRAHAHQLPVRVAGASEGELRAQWGNR